MVIAELFQITNYFGDSQIEQECINRFMKGIKPPKYEKKENVKNLRSEIATILGVFFNYRRNDVLKILMMKHLVDSSSNTILLLEETQARGIDIKYLFLQNFTTDEWNGRDYDAQLEKISVLCPNLKYLVLAVSEDALFSRLPDSWKASLTHLTIGYKTNKLPVEALDNMPSLKCLMFCEENGFHVSLNLWVLILISGNQLGVQN